MFNSYPNATYEKVYHIPRPKMETVVKKGRIYGQRKNIDFVHEMRKVDDMYSPDRNER